MRDAAASDGQAVVDLVSVVQALHVASRQRHFGLFPRRNSQPGSELQSKIRPLRNWIAEISGAPCCYLLSVVRKQAGNPSCTSEFGKLGFTPKTLRFEASGRTPTRAE